MSREAQEQAGKILMLSAAQGHQSVTPGGPAHPILRCVLILYGNFYSTAPRLRPKRALGHVNPGYHLITHAHRAFFFRASRWDRVYPSTRLRSPVGPRLDLDTKGVIFAAGIWERVKNCTTQQLQTVLDRRLGQTNGDRAAYTAINSIF